MSLSVEDIFSESLQILGQSSTADDDDGLVRYGDVLLSVPPKEGKAITLLADQLFSPSLLLAELIETGEISVRQRTVLELGAGCALPSIIASLLPPSEAPSTVVVTDYPDPIILDTLRKNLEVNQKLIVSGCNFQYYGYEWGQDVSKLLTLLSCVPMASPTGYDVLFLSDLLHFSTSHDALIFSLTSLLAHEPHSRAYVSAGTYTAAGVCKSFIDKTQAMGMWWREGQCDGDWKGTKVVEGLSVEEMGLRKRSCRWWVGGWKEVDSDSRQQ